MLAWIPIPALLPTVALLIWAEIRGRRKLVYVIKPAATLMVILVVAIPWWNSPAAEPVYCGWILAGLVLSLAGDVALMFTTSKAFLAGTVAFLLAHLAYIAAFSTLGNYHPADLLTAGALLVAAVVFYRAWSPKLGVMKVPVALYILVICLMVNRALSVGFNDVRSTQAWLIVVGALSFWVSDLMLGINRFGRPFRWHRFSLAFYYAGQLLIALSASY